jgi:hypothetical protein
MTGRVRDDLDERLAQYETLIERTAPPADRFVCRCDRCRYEARYTRRQDQETAA